MVLKGGRFQTDIFLPVDINEWIALHIFFFSSSWHRKEIEGKEGQRLERNALTSIPGLSEKIGIVPPKLANPPVDKWWLW